MLLMLELIDDITDVYHIDGKDLRCGGNAGSERAEEEVDSG